MASMMLKAAGHLVYKLRGWHFEPLPDYWVSKQVLVAFPHSDVLDSWMAFSGFAMIKQKGHIVIKKEAFRFPWGPILRGLGGVPVDRSSRTGLVAQITQMFKERDPFQLAIVPEGTRGGVSKLKTGFWHIAKAAEVPIVLWLIDTPNKRTVWVGRLIPGDDINVDLRRLKKMYAGFGHDITSIKDAPEDAPPE
jgi:1-acyl-sn-glycerol-3-phosphate acyltransferase